MSRFVFRNQRLLEHLERLEEERKNELAVVMGKINRQQSVIETARSGRRKVLAGAAPGRLDGTATAVRCLFFGSYERSSAVARGVIRSLQGELAAARTAYLKARQKREALDRLKAKRKQEFGKKEDDALRKETDDIAGQRYIRIKERNREEQDA